VELNPAALRYDLPDERLLRGVITHQDYWQSLGSWSPEHWCWKFAVFAAGQLVGLQELEGTDFPRLRTVDSASFLSVRMRGRGLGRQMRAAVLAVAFGPLGAVAAITSAWHDNHASLAVSRALGYQPNGESLERRSDTVDRMLHLRLTRADWLAGAARAVVTVTNVDAALPWFGLPSPDLAAHR